MSRYVGPSCRLCRREATKLFLKGTKCLTEKCPVERRAYPPGQHGQTGGRQRKASEYAKQMREKQKVKRMYGLSEQQFRNTFDDVTREPGVKGTNLLVALESRRASTTLPSIAWCPGRPIDCTTPLRNDVMMKCHH